VVEYYNFLNSYNIQVIIYASPKWPAFSICSASVKIEKSIPTKYSVSTIRGYVKGKLPLHLFQRYEKIGKRYWGRYLWSRLHCASTVGLNEEQIRTYVKWQNRKDKELGKQQLMML
jgi:putative transposase